MMIYLQLHMSHIFTRKSVLPDLAKFRHFCTPLKTFGHFERVHSIFGKKLRCFSQILYAIGQVFNAAIGQN